MTREIKFRAWSPKTKRMYSAEEMAKDQMTLLPTGRFINVHSISTELSEIYSWDEMLPLQYTGLKDKNGKEIYEGDIIESLEKMFGGNGEKQNREVRFEGGAFMIGSVDLSIVTEDMPNGLSFEPVVVGNIYENPKLLKEEQNDKM